MARNLAPPYVMNPNGNAETRIKVLEVVKNVAGNYSFIDLFIYMSRMHIFPCDFIIVISPFTYSPIIT